MSRVVCEILLLAAVAMHELEMHERRLSASWPETLCDYSNQQWNPQKSTKKKKQCNNLQPTIFTFIRVLCYYKICGDARKLFINSRLPTSLD